MYVYLQHIYSIFIPAQKWPFLAKKNNYFSETFAKSTKRFRRTLSWIMCGNIYGKKTSA